MINKEPSYIYEIRIEGHLMDHWTDWFDGMEIYPEPSGDTILRGRVKDQAALLGILNKLYSFNLTITGLTRVIDAELY